MSIFSTILEKLGLQKPAAAQAASPAPSAGAAAKPMMAATPAPTHAPMPGAAPVMPAAPAKPAPMAMVDVTSKLDKMAGDNPGFDWKVSIVDLLKLLKMDSSLESRKTLAQELGCPADLIGGDYSKMNIWLHKTVMQKIADNGGNIPQNLLS